MISLHDQPRSISDPALPLALLRTLSTTLLLALTLSLSLALSLTVITTLITIVLNVTPALALTLVLSLSLTQSFCCLFHPHTHRNEGDGARGATAWGGRGGGPPLAGQLFFSVLINMHMQYWSKLQ